MNFLVDAQLPRRLAYRLRDAGHDALHTLDLPKRNRTTDAEIHEISQANVASSSRTTLILSTRFFLRASRISFC